MTSERQFCLPDVGEGLTEGEVVRWLVGVGDSVTVNQPLVEVETAKAAVELPSPFAGVVTTLHAEEGELLPVGAPLVSIRTDGDEEAAPDDSAGAAESGSGPLLVGYGVTEAPAQRRRRVAGPHGTLRPEAGPPGEPVKPVRHGGLEVGRAAEAKFADASTSVRAKPPVRRLARQLGIDLGSVRATGAEGTVTRGDVEAAAALLAPGRVVAPVVGGRREAVRGVTRTMAAAMTESATTIPSVTEWVDADVTRSAQLLERMRRLPEYADLPVTPLLMVAAACLAALRRNPRLNAWFDRDAQEIVHRSSVDLGVAVATDRGLVVPHLSGADALSLAELARGLGDVVQRAREGTAAPGDLVGGTFTITNVGVFGIDGGTPMIVPGQSAILAFGSWRERPWVDRGQVVVRTVCTVSVSFDHRFVDGATGSRFLRDVADVLEEPALLHLY
jgi:pyruvate dehydrogenase E2 component (dihydrolipoamide acetyltransferase)